MPLSTSLITTVGFAAALLTQVQDPTFDVQVAIPRDRKPAQTENSRTTATQTSVSTDAPPPTGARTAPTINLSHATPQAQTAPAPSGALSAQDAYNNARRELQAGSSLAPQRPLPPVPTTPKPPTPQSLYDGVLQVTPAPQALPALPPGQIWTWDKSQLKQFDDAAKAFRDWMMKEPGFERFQRREFGFYATPLNPGEKLPQYFIFRDQNGKVFVSPKQNGQSPNFYYSLPGKDWAFPKAHSQPGQKWTEPKIYTLPPLNGTTPKMYILPPQWTEPKVYASPYQPWTSPRAHLNIQSKSDTIFGTLTPHQKEIQKTRGYLHFNELTPAQQKLLTHPKGQFEIQYRSGANDLTIKD